MKSVISWSPSVYCSSLIGGSAASVLSLFVSSDPSQATSERPRLSLDKVFFFFQDALMHFGFGGFSAAPHMVQKCEPFLSP